MAAAPVNAPGDDARRNERGRIHQNGRRARDPNGDQQLPGIVPGRLPARSRQSSRSGKRWMVRHDKMGGHAARDAEEHRRHAAGKNAAEHNAHEQDLPPAAGRGRAMAMSVTILVRPSFTRIGTMGGICASATKIVSAMAVNMARTARRFVPFMASLDLHTSGGAARRRSGWRMW